MTTNETAPSVRPADTKGSQAAYIADDIAAKLQISTRQVWRLNDSGRMPSPIRIGRLVRWSVASIDQWIVDGCPPIRKGVR